MYQGKVWTFTRLSDHRHSVVSIIPQLLKIKPIPLCRRVDTEKLEAMEAVLSEAASVLKRARIGIDR
jgi:hypothetical protein